MVLVDGAVSTSYKLSIVGYRTHVSICNSLAAIFIKVSSYKWPYLENDERYGRGYC